MTPHLYTGPVVKRALHTYISFKFTNLFLAFFFQIAVAKILSPPHYATYAVLLGAVMASERALSFGIDRAILRFVPALTRHCDIAGLRGLILRVLLLRLTALAIFLFIGTFAFPFVNLILPIQLGTSALLAIGIRFLCLHAHCRCGCTRSKLDGAF